MSVGPKAQRFEGPTLGRGGDSPPLPALDAHAFQTAINLCPQAMDASESVTHFHRVGRPRRKGTALLTTRRRKRKLISDPDTIPIQNGYPQQSHHLPWGQSLPELRAHFAAGPPTSVTPIAPPLAPLRLLQLTATSEPKPLQQSWPPNVFANGSAATIKSSLASLSLCQPALLQGGVKLIQVRMPSENPADGTRIQKLQVPNLANLQVSLNAYARQANLLNVSAGSNVSSSGPISASLKLNSTSVQQQHLKSKNSVIATAPQHGESQCQVGAAHINLHPNSFLPIDEVQQVNHTAHNDPSSLENSLDLNSSINTDGGFSQVSTASAPCSLPHGQTSALSDTNSGAPSLTVQDAREDKPASSKTEPTTMPVLSRSQTEPCLVHAGTPQSSPQRLSFKKRLLQRYSH